MIASLSVFSSRRMYTLLTFKISVNLGLIKKIEIEFKFNILGLIEHEFSKNRFVFSTVLVNNKPFLVLL